MARTILVVANETIGGRNLLDAVRKHATEEEARFVLCVPQTRPKSGYVVYADAVYEAAQARVNLALDYLGAEGIHTIGEVGDPDPYTATIDAVREHRPDAILISTYPETRSGWLRHDLISRVEAATGLHVEHVVNDIDAEGLPFHVTLVVANRTGASDQVVSACRAKADEETDREHGRLFIVVVPQEGGDGSAVHRARTRLKLVLDRLHEAKLLAEGMIGDPDPFTATMNAMQYFRVDDLVIGTKPAEKSGWLRADLIERVRKASGKPLEHVVVDVDAAAAANA